MRALGLVMESFKVYNRVSFSSILGYRVVFGIISHVPHCRHVQRSRLLEVCGSRWYGQFFSKRPRCRWCRPCVEAGSFSPACAPATCGSEEAARDTLWKRQGMRLLLALKQEFHILKPKTINRLILSCKSRESWTYRDFLSKLPEKVTQKGPLTLQIICWTGLWRSSCPVHE